jgi:hypothetical protein
MTNVRRSIRLAGLAAVLSTSVIGSAAVAAAPAFAAGTTPTTLTVTSNKTTLTSGKSVAFTALVAPAKSGSTKITGAITWTVTGNDGSVVPCTTVTPLTPSGKSLCKIATGNLLAGSGPYTAAASYPGDATFGPSSGSGSVSVTSGTTRVKLALSATPTGGAAITVTATVAAGPGTPLVQGNVVFTISSQYHAPGVTARCSGTLTPASLNNVKPLSAQVATCDLPAGWMVLPKASSSNPKPSDGWSVSGVYNGNGSFTTSFATKKGTAKF